MGEWLKQLPSKIFEFWNKYTTKQKTDLIEKLVKQWYDKQQLRKSISR